MISCARKGQLPKVLNPTNWHSSRGRGLLCIAHQTKLQDLPSQTVIPHHKQQAEPRFHHPRLPQLHIHLRHIAHSGLNMRCDICYDKVYYYKRSSSYERPCSCGGRDDLYRITSRDYIRVRHRLCRGTGWIRVPATYERVRCYYC